MSRVGSSRASDKFRSVVSLEENIGVTNKSSAFKCSAGYRSAAWCVPLCVPGFMESLVGLEASAAELHRHADQSGVKVVSPACTLCECEGLRGLRVSALQGEATCKLGKCSSRGKTNWVTETGIRGCFCATTVFPEVSGWTTHLFCHCDLGQR